VVYAAGAVCTRRARVTLPPGEGPVTVRVTGFSPALLEHSLRCRVTAEDAAGAVQVTDIRAGYGATLHRGDELPCLRLDLEDAEDRQSRLRESTERLRAEIAETAALRAEPPVPRRGDPPRWAPVESILALASFVDARLTTLHRRLRTAEQDQQQADHAVDVLRHRLTEASTATALGRTTPSATAYVTLTRPPAREATPTGALAPGGGRGDTDAGPGPGTRAGGSGLAPEGGPDGSGASGGRGYGSGPGDAAADGGSGPSGSGADGGPGAGPGGGSGTGDPADGDTGRRGDGPDGGRTDDGAGTSGGPGAEVVLDVEYQVPGACWVPVYQLRLDGRGGAAGLALRAMVAQRTGEDWTGVRLVLSTADLLRRTDLPELRSLRIGRRQPEPAGQSWREPPAGLGELFAGYDAARRPRTAEPEPDAVAASAVGGYGLAAGGAPDGDPAFGAPPPPPPAPGGPPRPMAPAAARAPLARSRGFAAPGAAPLAEAADGYAAPQAQAPAPPPGTPAPGADLLDYARLTLAGPDSPEEHRGTLRPPSPALGAVGGEYRSRADRVAGLARPAHAVDVRTSAGSFDHRFDTAAPADVAADGRWHTVPVGEVPVTADFVYVSVPSVDPAVFSTVWLANT
jgi:hypothetical protein